MQLIGMLDSPYVRRVAVSLQLLGLPFGHQVISVFRGYAQFSAINPVVKAPSLVCDDGTVLMDSTLILEYAEALAAPGKSLLPAELPARLQVLRVTGIALALMEKSVQIVYERQLRPAERQHQPWVDRVTGQLLAACALLEADFSARAPAQAGRIDQGGVSTAVAWQFARQMLPDVVPAADFPALQAFSEGAERLPAFAAAPHGTGTVEAGDAGRPA